MAALITPPNGENWEGNKDGCLSREHAEAVLESDGRHFVEVAFGFPIRLRYPELIFPARRSLFDRVSELHELVIDHRIRKQPFKRWLMEVRALQIFGDLV